jgi:adenosylcobinamide-phosphate synthase
MTALMIPAAARAGQDAAGAWRTMWKQHGRTASRNAGWSMSAMARALHVTLGEAGQYCLEGGTAEQTAATIGRATRLAGLAVTIFALVLTPALVWLGETVRAV